jgi:hypothetical protein
VGSDEHDRHAELRRDVRHERGTGRDRNAARAERHEHQPATGRCDINTISNRDPGDEHAFIFHDTTTNRIFYADSADCNLHRYTCSSDRYDYSYVYAHTDDGDADRDEHGDDAQYLRG